MNRWLLAGLLLTAGCGQSPMPAKTAWTGSLKLPDADVPLLMDLDLTGAAPSGHFTVGTERIPIPQITAEGMSLTLSFSEYGAEMRAAWNGRALQGEYVRLRASGDKTFPFSVMPAAAAAKPQKADPEPPTGIFQVIFEDRKPDDPVTLARFWKDKDAWLGTFIAADGDYGMLEAGPTAQGVQFSRFTGWQAIAIRLQPQGAAPGALWSGTFHAASNDETLAFTLQPADGLEIRLPPAKTTSMKDPNSPFAFSCTGLDGETVRHTDARFQGKALAVDIMGTWCHNCMDESPILQELYARYGKDGLEVVGLSFEIQDDAALGRKNLTLFRDRFRLTYPLLYCGSMDDANLDQRLRNQVQNFFAFPTTLFTGRNGRVQTVHSGFRGPGTGDQYPLQIQKLHELARQTLR